MYGGMGFEFYVVYGVMFGVQAAALIGALLIVVIGWRIMRALESMAQSVDRLSQND